jgi:hypothetical protein
VRTFQDLTGQLFFRLTVKGPAESRRQPDGRLERYWHCECVCGRLTVVKGANLRSHRIKSCGCWHDECARAQGSGMSKLPEYNILTCMIARCENPKNPAYEHYGARGIYVCERWKHDFWAFYHDVGPRPTAFHTIERINNNGPYSPENCCWATQTQQTRNYRRNIFLTFDGKTLCLSDWADITGINYGTLLDRYHSNRPWTVERLLTQPPRQWKRMSAKQLVADNIS